MFNHEAYQRRLDELKEDVRTHLQAMPRITYATWHSDVSLRYGRFLAARAAEQLQRAIDLFPGYEHVDDKQKHRDYCASEIMGVIAGMHASSALIRGAVLTSDPVGAEAMMRIYDEANKPHVDLPMPVLAVEPTDEQLQAFTAALRKRGPGEAVMILDKDACEPASVPPCREATDEEMRQFAESIPAPCEPESCDAFRKRVHLAAKVARADAPMLQTISMSSGSLLDHYGHVYGLVRAGAIAVAPPGSAPLAHD